MVISIQNCFGNVKLLCYSNFLKTTVIEIHKANLFSTLHRKVDWVERADFIFPQAVHFFMTKSCFSWLRQLLFDSCQTHVVCSSNAHLAELCLEYLDLFFQLLWLGHVGELHLVPVISGGVQVWRDLLYHPVTMSNGLVTDRHRLAELWQLTSKKTIYTDKSWLQSQIKTRY